MLKARKSLNFLTPPFLEAPVRGEPLRFWDEIWRQKRGADGWAKNQLGERRLGELFFGQQTIGRQQTFQKRRFGERRLGDKGL